MPVIEGEAVAASKRLEKHLRKHFRETYKPMKILDHVYMITMISERNGVIKEGICYSAPATNKTDAWANFLRQEQVANTPLPSTFNAMKAMYRRKGYMCTKVIVGVEE